MRRWRLAVVFVFLAGGLTRPMWAASQQPPQNPNQISLEDSLLRGFTVTLALGEIEGGRSSGTFTPAATKALADLKDFLPYKSYRPLDTVWMLGLNGPHQFLLGQDGQKHEFYMRSTLISPVAIKVDMLRLWDVVPAGSRAAGPAALIDTSFNLKVGETVAVGTSRIDSNRGLILLVTAAQR
jgi:hypothetical protein